MSVTCTIHRRPRQILRERDVRYLDPSWTPIVISRLGINISRASRSKRGQQREWRRSCDEKQESKADIALGRYKQGYDNGKDHRRERPSFGLVRTTHSVLLRHVMCFSYMVAAAHGR